MKDPYLLLTCIILGPNNPKAKIDVYLQPLIDELNGLWCDSILTYDILTKQNFILRVALMWTTNDFLAYGMLSRQMIQGKLACLIYMEDTKIFTLKDTKTFTMKYGEKNSWFNYHRRFLYVDHTYRHSRYQFRKNTIENEEALVRLTC